MLSIQPGQTHALWPASSCQSTIVLNTVTDMPCTDEQRLKLRRSKLDPASARTGAGATTGTIASISLYLASGHNSSGVRQWLTVAVATCQLGIVSAQRCDSAMHDSSRTSIAGADMIVGPMAE